jgi:hypothetical protein
MRKTNKPEPLLTRRKDKETSKLERFVGSTKNLQSDLMIVQVMSGV